MERDKSRSLVDEILFRGVTMDKYEVIPESIHILTGRNPKVLQDISVRRIISLKTDSKKGKTTHQKYEIDTEIGTMKITLTLSTNSWRLEHINLKE